jgi:hypothetical protein
MKADISISVLLPTRGRTDALKRSVLTLLETAADPRSVEILLAFDEDDTDSVQYFQDHVVHKIDDLAATYVAVQTPRLGYVRLNEYVNLLAGHAQGRWFMFWNDDAVMQSRAWDDRIRAHDGHFRVLRMPTHREHPYAIFPILPRDWYELFGYISDHQISDAWVSQIAYMLDIMHNIDVVVVHDRHDLTGNNADATFQQRVMLEGWPSDPRDFNHLTWRNRRVNDAARICEMLEQQGQSMTWFRSVIAGQQDPWAKMTSAEFDPNRQLAVFK